MANDNDLTPSPSPSQGEGDNAGRLDLGAFLRLPIDERGRILAEQFEAFVRELPDYYSPEVSEMGWAIVDLSNKERIGCLLGEVLVAGVRFLRAELRRSDESLLSVQFINPSLVKRISFVEKSIAQMVCDRLKVEWKK